MQKSKKIMASTLLIWLCWLVYACSYIGKLNYNASINQVMSFYNVDKDQAGLVGTFFFFAYGAGQVINGIFCKKYNLKWVVFASLLTAGIVNLCVGLAPSFGLIKYLWLANGMTMSVLWPCVIRFLAESLSKKDMARATVTIGTTGAFGMFFAYGISALFAEINFKVVFYVATTVLIGVAFLWAFSVSKLSKSAKAECEQIEEAIAETKGKEVSQGRFSKKLLVAIIILFCFFGVATNFVKDGLATWLPTILKDQYGFKDSISLILTFSFSLLGLFGNAFATHMHRKVVKDFVLHDGIIFLVATVFIGVVMAGLSVESFLISLLVIILGIIVVKLFIASSNSLITSIFPLYMKGKVNSGLMAGILNGCCYVGSMASSYGLGLIAKNFGWTVAFWVLFTVCAIVTAIATVYFVVKKLIEKIKDTKLTVED